MSNDPFSGLMFGINFWMWSVLPAVVSTLFFIAGCGRMTSPRYFIYMVNRTPRDFEGVGVYFNGTMAADKGHLVKGGLASFGYVTLPIPDEAEVRWVDQGVHHAKKVKLKGVIPNDLNNMNLYFIIETNGAVTVAYARYDDQEARAKITKGREKFWDKRQNGVNNGQ